MEPFNCDKMSSCASVMKQVVVEEECQDTSSEDLFVPMKPGTCNNSFIEIVKTSFYVLNICFLEVSCLEHIEDEDGDEKCPIDGHSVG